MTQSFDEYAEQYDQWFLDNTNVLGSELALVAYCLDTPGHTLSVGCGSGLFEMLLARDYGIQVADGIEPSSTMAEIARKRGVNVRVGTAEEIDYGERAYGTVLFNGTASYISDLGMALGRAIRALRPGGRVVLLDVPAESSYGILYSLAALLGSWDHQLVRAIRPTTPYPIPFAQAAHWRPTLEKADLLRAAGFVDLRFAQTLTRHPFYSNDMVETPVEGFDRGDYVGIVATRPEGRRA